MFERLPLCVHGNRPHAMRKQSTDHSLQALTRTEKNLLNTVLQANPVKSSESLGNSAMPKVYENQSYAHTSTFVPQKIMARV